MGCLGAPTSNGYRCARRSSGLCRPQRVRRPEGGTPCGRLDRANNRASEQSCNPRCGERSDMKRFILLGFVVALIGSLAVAQEGVTDTEIVIGNWGPQSGPAAAWGAVTVAIEAYFEYVNDQGGIHGRNLVLATREDRKSGV